MEQQTDSSKAMQVITVILLTILVAFAAYFVITVTKGDDTDVDEVKQVQEETEDEKEDIVVDITDEDEVVEEVSEQEQDEEIVGESTNKIPDGWKSIENANYGYTAYRPSSYYYRFFGSQATLGIDPSDIPEVSEYVGAIFISALDGDLESAKNNYITSFLAIAETTETHDNGVWTVITATIPENLIPPLTTPEMQVLLSFIEKEGQIFVVDYRSEALYFSDYEDVFNAFYPAILFD